MTEGRGDAPRGREGAQHGSGPASAAPGAAGGPLEQLRELTDGYTPPDWACNTFRALLDALHELELELHQHIHKENNILFPKALDLETARR